MRDAKVLYRMLSVASSKKEFTTETMARATGHNQKTIADMLAHYRNEGYFRKLPKKDGRFYRYMLNKKGLQVLHAMRR